MHGTILAARDIRIRMRSLLCNVCAVCSIRPDTPTYVHSHLQISAPPPFSCLYLHRLSLPFRFLSTRGNISGDMKRRRRPVSYTSASMSASHRCHICSSLRRQGTRNTDTTYGSWLPRSRTGMCAACCCVTHDEKSALRWRRRWRKAHFALVLATLTKAPDDLGSAVIR